MSLRAHWKLDPSISYLNHGSFGACPTPVLEEQARWRDRLETEPARFFIYELEAALDAVRAEVGAFLDCDGADLAFVTNATQGVNTVLRALAFERGDELLTTNHAYNACKNALDATAARCEAKVVVAEVPFPIRSPEQALDAVLARATPRTKLALLDWVTSPTGMVLPVPELVKELQRRGIDSLVDAAHVPGMLPARLRALNAAYVTGNFHKWCCTPKGSAFLFVRKDRQAYVRPMTVSHGATSPRRDRSRFEIEFDWTGTHDPTAHLAVPAALRFLGGLFPGGWPELMRRNHALAVQARGLLCRALGVEPACPDEMIGSLAAVALPDAPEAPRPPVFVDALQEQLLAEERIEVPVMFWPKPPRRWVRVSAQVYNELSEYERLAAALKRKIPSPFGRGDAAAMADG